MPSSSTVRTAVARAVPRRVRHDPRVRSAALHLGLIAPPRPASVKALRLVPDPVFVFSATRSGSTLLRVVLNTHSEICAPHELQMNSFKVTEARPGHVANPMKEMGLSFRELENMLWDRVLYGHLQVSGKRIVVDKTPQNIPDWERIAAYWPKARFVHLRRHPAAILASRLSSLEEQSMERHLRTLNTYGRQLNEARAVLPGPTLRYEDLTTDPERTVRKLCDYLGVAFEPAMLRYDTSASAKIVQGLGDMSATIRTGRIQPARPVTGEIPAELHELCRQWGYL
jgi:hypothetical protein